MNPDLLEMMAGRDDAYLLQKQKCEELMRVVELERHIAFMARPSGSCDYGDINEEQRQRRHTRLLEKYPVQSDWVQG